jgi:FAD/FMN-containing dehydrogenase
LAFNLMQELDVNETAQTIAYGPGTRWVDVYDALDPYGLYCIGGRMKTIGSAGLTLIGGWHYLNNKYGYAMDNVISYDVVLGNGTQVVASKTSNPDLFWALKGGALNFGIVTRFLVQAYKIPQISTTMQSFSEDQIEAFVHAACELAENDDPSIGAGGVISISYNTTTKSASGSLLGVQEGTESPPSRFEAFSAINPVSRVDAVQTPSEWHSVLETPNQMFRYRIPLALKLLI